MDHHVGIGNWQAFSLPLKLIHDASVSWRNAVRGIERPWLCWHVNDRWTALQTRLVKAVGWTPVVGFDPRFGAPTAALDAVVLDFNRGFDLPLMYMHFPLEFAFLWTPRLAFWHSDLLCRLDVMEQLAGTFDSLADGQLAAVRDLGGRRNWLNFRKHRYWELAACTTAAASEDQFRHGTGWWQRFDCHPNCPSDRERRRRSKHYYDHGTGIMYWRRHCGGDVVPLDRRPLEEGHCTSINHPDYKRLEHVSRKLLGKELTLNFDLDDSARRLNIDHLLD